MAIDIKKYMSDLVRQLNLSHMDEPTRAQLADWKKKGIATKNQSGWDPDAKLPNIYSAVYRDGSAGTVYDDYHKIREELVLLARDLAADSSLEDNKDVQGFLKDFYGASKAIPLFAIAEIPEAEEIATYIEKRAPDLAAQFDSPDDLDVDKLAKLAKALRSGGYKTDPKAHKTLQAFLSNVRQNAQDLPERFFPPSWKHPTTVDDAYAKEVLAYITEPDGKTPKGEIVELLKRSPEYLGVEAEDEVEDAISGLRRNDAETVRMVLGWIGKRGDISRWPTKNIPSHWKDADNDEFDIDKLRAEKQHLGHAGYLNIARLRELQNQLKKPSIARHMPHRMFVGGKHAEIFDRIISKDKLRDAVTARGGDIAKWISAGLKESNYKDGDDKVDQKFTDRKRRWPRGESTIKSLYVNTLGKLFDKHERHVYVTNARYVVPGLLKEKVKPTDGLGKVLEKLDGIAAKQTAPVAKQIKWMKEKLGAMSNTTQFKEALTYGGQMRQVVHDLISVTRAEDMEAAKMTLEVLAVMSSTLTTSAVREELRKMPFTLVGDPSMSFNKGGLGVFTKAVDQTLRLVTLAAYETGNFVANAIKKSGGRIKKDELKSAAESEGTELSDDEMRRAELMAFWNFVNSGANTDWNISKAHSDVQKAADAKATLKDKHGNPKDEIKFKMGGREVVRKKPTVKDVELIEYMIKQQMAERAA